MKTYSLEDISRIMKGSILQQANDDPVEHILLDSRKLLYPESSAFFALVSDRRNAHDYIPDLYQKGVRNFVISDNINLSEFPQANFIQVKNTLQALHALTIYHRQQFTIPVIGITGSNGKTIVKEWLAQLLEPDYNIVRSPKSYNSQIGVPLSVWEMAPEHQLAIFEAGISQPGEMTNLEKIIHPDIGIFTNIGEAHNEGFLNVRQKINEKLILFTYSKVLIYCKDYPELNECILHFHNQVKQRDANGKRSMQLFTWSKKSEAGLRIVGLHKNTVHTDIEVSYQEQNFSVRIPFTDDGSIENAVHCLCLMLYFNIPVATIRERMPHLGKIAMRLELKQGINQCSIINDSYNSDLGSLSIALDFLEQQKQHTKKTVILSDILQSGRSESRLYAEVAEMLQQKMVRRLIGIGKAISREKNIFQQNPKLQSVFYSTTEEFIHDFHPQDFQHETILLKGARIFEFEKISQLLEQKIHQTVLEINLSAIAHNLKQYQSLLKPPTKIMAMVKAFSYGSGSFEIANLLQFLGVDYLAVAYADEGVELRRAGITIPIMVMNPEPSNFDAIIQWKLEPELYSLVSMQAFEEAVKQAHLQQFPVHIKLDTGMHRLGLVPDELEEAIKFLEHSPLHVVSVFSHLAASEDPEQDSFTRRQALLFEDMSNMIMQQLPYKIIRHIANSAAIHRHPHLQYDLVRLGIGLYGIDNDRNMQSKLKNVSTLKTTVAQVKKLAAGETTGYGRKGVANTPKTIATVRIGYADGYNRILGNGRGKMLIHKEWAPVIGNICMDMLMLDVTAIPGVKEGDEMIVFGNDLPISVLAKWADTIPYEIMTTISQRVKRVYFEE